MTTSAPSSASRSATARPRRFADPVTSATRPSRDSLFRSEGGGMLKNDTIAGKAAKRSPRAFLHAASNHPTCRTARIARTGRLDESRSAGDCCAPRRRRTHLRRHALENGAPRLQNRNPRFDRGRNGNARYPGDPGKRSRARSEISRRKVARHTRRARFRRPAKPPAQIAARGHDPATPSEDRYPPLLGSAASRPLPRLDSRLRGVLPGGTATASYRRRGLPPLQNTLCNLLLRRRPAHLRRGHHRAIPAAPQGHSRLRVAIPAQQPRKEKPSAPCHQPPGSRDEPASPALRPDDRSGVWRALPAKGTDEGRGRCKAGSSLNLKLKLLIFLSGRKPRDVMAAAGALDPHTNLRFVLGPGFAQDHYRIQRLGIQPGDQVNVAGAVFLPKLANLDLGDAHKGLLLTVE